MQLPSSTSKLERKTENCRLLIGDISVTPHPDEMERDAFDPPLEHLAMLSRIQSQAMATLYEKYAQFIYSVSLRILHNPTEAEDVLQEVFLRIWRSPEQLKIGQTLRPWIAVVSRNSSIDIIRRRRPSESIEDVTLVSPNDTSVQAELNLMCEKARALIDQLPLEQRTVLEMAYFRGMTHAEIADKTGSPLGTVKTRIRDALKNLRKNLQLATSVSTMQSEKA